MRASYHDTIHYQHHILEVQTEDWGFDQPWVVTNLFCEGQLLQSQKQSYAHLVAAQNAEPEPRVTQMMAEQHRAMIKRLLAGELDQLLQASLSSLSQTTSVAPSHLPPPTPLPSPPPPPTTTAPTLQPAFAASADMGKAAPQTATTLPPSPAANITPEALLKALRDLDILGTHREKQRQTLTTTEALPADTPESNVEPEPEMPLQAMMGDAILDFLRKKQ